MPTIPEITEALAGLGAKAAEVRAGAVEKLNEIRTAYTDRKAAGPDADERAKIAEITESRDAAIAAIEIDAEELRAKLAELKAADTDTRSTGTDAGADTRADAANAATQPEPRAAGVGSRYECRSSARSYTLPVSAAHREQSADHLRSAYWSQVLDRPVDGMAMSEARSVEFDVDTEGGFLAPAPVVADILKQVDDIVQLRQYATVRPSNLSGLGYPSIETKLTQGNWGGEITTLTKNNSLKFGKRELKPNIYRDLVLVSNVSLAAGMAETLVTNELARAAGEAQEQAFITGSGAGQPLGLFTANAAGVPAARDVNTGSATAFTVEGLVDLKGSLKQEYRNRAHWLLHREALTQIERLKDSDGLPIWQRSIEQGRPDRLLGIPVLETEFAPNTFTDGNYGAILGDLSRYVIADAMAISVQRNPYEYQKQNQTAFYVQFHVDGMPASIGGEAFARQKFST